MFLLQTINFFKLGTKLSLVDLPGYGFAYAKEEVKDAWEELVSLTAMSFIASVLYDATVPIFTSKHF